MYQRKRVKNEFPRGNEIHEEGKLLFKKIQVTRLQFFKENFAIFHCPKKVEAKRM